MKPGDMVRYKIFPHEELHSSGMTGLVLTAPKIVEDESLMAYPEDQLVIIDVIWSADRGLRCPAGTVTWEYVDEIEVIGEDR